MHTEDEAKKLWCPFARDGAISEAHFPDKRASGFMCIASACAAWRWERGTGSSIVRTKDEMIRRDDGSVYFRPVPPDGDGWHQQWVDSKHANRRETGFTDWIRSHDTEEFTWGSPRKGHCGLAGEPK